MNKLFIKYLSIIAVIYVLSLVQDNIFIKDIPYLLLLGGILMLVNLFIRPLLLLLVLPFNLITFGIFTLFVNMFVIWLANVMTPGITIQGFVNYLCIAIGVWLINAILQKKHS